MERESSIGEAAQADAEVLAALIRESFQDVAMRFSLTPENCPKHPSNCTVEWVRSDQTRGVQYFMLSESGVPVGCIGLEKRSPELFYLERLAVLPHRRCNGYGRALVLHALSHAQASGARRVSVGIIADHTELRQWYTNLGFAEVETKTLPHLPFRVALLEWKSSWFQAGE